MAASVLARLVYGLDSVDDHPPVADRRSCGATSDRGGADRRIPRLAAHGVHVQAGVEAEARGPGPATSVPSVSGRASPNATAMSACATLLASRVSSPLVHEQRPDGGVERRLARSRRRTTALRADGVLDERGRGSPPWRRPGRAGSAPPAGGSSRRARLTTTGATSARVERDDAHERDREPRLERAGARWAAGGARPAPGCGPALRRAAVRRAGRRPCQRSANW